MIDRGDFVMEDVRIGLVAVDALLEDGLIVEVQGGRNLQADALDALFQGLDKIEDAPGLYKPITLNMIGLILKDMGNKLVGDPSRLIQKYLRDSWSKANPRDFAKPLLKEMSSGAMVPSR